MLTTIAYRSHSMQIVEIGHLLVCWSYVHPGRGFGVWYRRWRVL